MYLCETIEDAEGGKHEMAGVFPAAAKMEKRLVALGYREVRLTAECFLGQTGTRIGGHEFHYSGITPMPDGIERVFDLGRGREGFRIKNTIGGYVHLHFGSNPQAAAGFAAALRGQGNS